MATSLSNETSTTSLMEINQDPTISGNQYQECSYLSNSKFSNAATKTDINGSASSGQGANVTTSSNQISSSSSLVKNRGDQIQSASNYQQQQSALIQSASLAYPLFQPNYYLTGFPQTSNTAQFNYSTSGVGNGNMQNSQNSSGASNNRRGGKKKAPTTQQSNPELRLFFNLRRRDSQIQTNKGQSHIYKPKNPPQLSEWFKTLSVEERVNALSTVCPHLTETFLNMYQRIDQSGQSSFARIGPNSQEQKYFQTPSYLPAYQGLGSIFSSSGSDSSMSSFEEQFYHRPFSDTEIQAMKPNDKEKGKIDSEQVSNISIQCIHLQEILKHIRLTDYFTFLDTLTVSEELVQDPDYFFKLMSYATNNQAFSSICQFEVKTSNVTVIEQPNWFKPKSFHNFATWIIVALEENLWAQEKTDMGAQDVDLQQLSQFWRDTNEKDKKSLIDQFKALVIKEAEQEFNQNHSGHSKTQRSYHNKQMSYSLHIKERPDKQTFQEQVELELKFLIDFALRTGSEQELLTSLLYTSFDKSSQRQVSVNRKFLDLIKKKFKDDLMENLLQEEYSTSKSSKQFKKKKKKNFNSNNQQSAQSTLSNSNNNLAAAGDKSATPTSSTENIVPELDNNSIQEPIQLKGKKKKSKQNNANCSDKVSTNMSSQEQISSSQLHTQKKKKKHNQNSNFRNSKEIPQINTSKDLHSCDEQQPKIDEIIDKEGDISEVDIKNSSLDTKSSSNLFELATAHQSNNSNRNSSLTVKSTSKDEICISNKNSINSTHAVNTQNMLQIQQSKSLDLNKNNDNNQLTDLNNESPQFKQQKITSKVESKNLQILQSSQDLSMGSQSRLNRQEDQQQVYQDQSLRIKNNAWAKGVAKQPDPHKNNKKKINHQKKIEENSEQEQPIFTRSNNKEIKKPQSIESNNNESSKEDTQPIQNLNKKKRNKKKGKLTDTDIMNNFMKNLHSQSDETKESDYKLGNSNGQNYKKKSYEPKQTNGQKLQYKPQMDSISESQQSSIKSEQSTGEDTKEFSKPYQQKSYKQKQYSQKSSHTQINQNFSNYQSQTVEYKNYQTKRDDEEQSQQANAQQDQSQPQQTQVYQVKRITPREHKTFNKFRSQNKPLDHISIIDDKDSISSNKGDYISDDRSSQSCSEKPINPENQSNQRNGAFRQLNFQNQNEYENSSYTDLTATSNTANDSLDNNYNLQSLSKYQSYQNTPSKNIVHTQKNYHKQHFAHQNLQANDQDTANYRTPPQLSKKQCSQSNYSHHGNNYRKQHHNTQQHHYQGNQLNNNDSHYNQSQNGYNQNHNGHHKNSQRTQGQYRQNNNRGGNQNSNVYVQQMNLSQTMQEQRQFMQTYINPESNNMYYQEPNMLVNLNQNVDTYCKPQEGVFQYVEKNPMMLPQPIPSYSPNNFQVNQYGQTQANEILTNPFNSYSRMNVPYFDQSQDLIFQIFNSIKSNHSMSPIPQIISPPPLLDFQISQSSDLSLQAQHSEAQQNYINQQETQFYQILDNEIDTFVNQIQDNLNQFKPERDYVYNKLAEIACTVFAGQHPKLELFGSLTTGLALESSDMDLAVTGLQIDDRFIMISELNKLAQALQDWECLESFKSIETASIPVIKMKVDLMKLREQEIQEREVGDFAKRSIPENQRYLSVDITFDDSPVSSQFSTQSFSAQDLLGSASQTKTHLGLQSCALVQQYILTYKNLKPVAILLKKFLSEHDMNSPYYGNNKSLVNELQIGGISSYSTVILVVAYMNYYGLKGHHDLSPARLLMGFLDFYAHYFNPGSMGISVYDEGSFFQLNSLLDSNFVILDPLNLQNNTTRNSYHTKEILLKFQCAFNNLKSLMYKLPQLQQAAHSSQAAFSRANSQDQKSSIPFEIESPQPAIFLPNACNIQQTSNNQYQQNANQEAEDGSDQIPQIIPLEEKEASNLALGAIKDSQINKTLNVQVNLLETFFAKETPQIEDHSSMSSSQTEPRGTQITMIEAHV